MPILKIITNINKTDIPSDFLDKLVPVCAKAMGKPTEGIVCTIRGDASMYFVDGGSKAPGAMIDITIAEVGPEINLRVTEALTQHFHQELGITPSRLLIQFSDVITYNVAWHGTRVDILLQRNAIPK